MDDGGLPSLNARVAIVGAPLWRARLAQRLLAWPGLSLHVLGSSGDDLADLFDTAPADRFFLHHGVARDVRAGTDHVRIVGAAGQELDADLVVASEAGDNRVITPGASSKPLHSGAANADELADEVIGLLSARTLASPDTVHPEAPGLALIQVSDRVQHGRKLGRTLGYPTANLRLGPQPPSFGVYAVRARLGERRLEGVASVGVNPTVGEVAPVLEVFLFDFDEEIYGQVLTVELVAYLREERRFSGLAPLVAQIRRDVTAARARLATSR